MSPIELTTRRKKKGKMTVRAVLARLLSIDRAEIIVECRYCGRTVDSETEECPECGSRDFAKYNLSN